MQPKLDLPHAKCMHTSVMVCLNMSESIRQDAQAFQHAYKRDGVPEHQQNHTPCMQSLRPALAPAFNMRE
jgi:hypothetical protein